MRVQYDRFGPFFWVHFDTRLYFHFSFLARCSSDIHFLGLLWQLGLARNQFLLSRRLQIRLQYYRSFLHIEQPNSIWYFSLSLLDCSNKKEEDKSCWLSKVPLHWVLARVCQRQRVDAFLMLNCFAYLLTYLVTILKNNIKKMAHCSPIDEVLSLSPIAL